MSNPSIGVRRKRPSNISSKVTSSFAQIVLLPSLPQHSLYLIFSSADQKEPLFFAPASFDARRALPERGSGVKDLLHITPALCRVTNAALRTPAKTKGTLALPAHHFLPAGALTGKIRVPGDKSISHRAIMFGALAVGETRITGLLEGEDVLATAQAMRQMGAHIQREEDGTYIVNGVGVGGLLEPEAALDMGNSGTSTRLLMGLIAGHAITANFTGDASLSSRPMNRVIVPLEQMAAQFTPSPGGTLPLMMRGAQPAVPITYRLPVASAQVKSAVLLAALNTPGTTTVIEPVPTRDHTERMLKGFGVAVETTLIEGERHIAITGPADFSPCAIEVPGDPSSAAFFIAAALITPGSDLVIANVGLNETRSGIVTVLRKMGGSIEELNAREIGGEPVADLRVRHSQLKGIEVDPALAPAMIDEFPVLFVAAALAQGTTLTSGLEELRVKESDRLSAMAEALKLAGAEVQEHEDGLTIIGTGGRALPGSGEEAIATKLDHRIAMSMAIAGLASEHGVTLDDVSPISTSFPGFMDLLSEAAA
jgi:3-phosphoshikimate 1-carboxyvinyltransferase